METIRGAEPKGEKKKYDACGMIRTPFLASNQADRRVYRPAFKGKVPRR